MFNMESLERLEDLTNAWIWTLGALRTRADADEGVLVNFNSDVLDRASSQLLDMTLKLQDESLNLL